MNSGKLACSPANSTAGMHRRDFLRFAAGGASIAIASKAEASDGTEYNPMRPGAQVYGYLSWGTLTCFVEDFVQPLGAAPVPTLPTRKFWVTCAHVFQPVTNGNLELPVFQPGLDGISNYAGLIWAYANNRKADATLVLLNDDKVLGHGGRPFTRSFTNIPTKTNDAINKILTGPADPLPPRPFYIVGMESGLVSATYKDVWYDQFHEGFRIIPATRLAHGDSGAPVIDDQGKLVGIVTQASPDMDIVGCCRADSVFYELGDALMWRAYPKQEQQPTTWRYGIRLCNQ